MRRPTSAFAKAVLGTALAATTVSAQQPPPMPPPGSATEAAPVPPLNAARGARYLLRNGWDYIDYQEYERALGFLREAESRQFELNDSEKLRLKQGIERAQRGLREAANGVNSQRSYAVSGPSRRPGALALANPAPAPAAPGRERPAVEREPIQLAGGGAVAATPAPAPLMTPAPIPPAPDAGQPAFSPAAEPATADPAARQAAGPAEFPVPSPAEPAPLPVSAPAPVPVPATVAAAPAPAPAQPLVAMTPPPAVSAPVPNLLPPPDDIVLPALPGDPAATPAPAPAATPVPAPSTEAPADLPPMAADSAPVPVRIANANASANAEAAPAPAPATEPALDESSLPPLPTGLGGNGPAGAPVATSPAVEPPPAPAAETLPAPAAETLPAPVPVPVPTPDPAPTFTPEPANVPAPAFEPSAPGAGVAPRVLTDTPPPPMGATAPRPANPRGRFGTDTLVPERGDTYTSTLTPEQQREVDQIAARQDEEMRRTPQPAFNPDPNATPEAPPSGPGGTTGSATTRLEISRAPSPTEARPIRAIPVPEEFVPLPKREWDPNRKLWAAAATCHLPLYFQDASLERYGYSVEQHFGPIGRFLSYPVDDPRQSKQRNQLLQPVFSAGLFAAQIALMPYNLIMDPPWEAEYDLGYYRPGDRVPTDVFYLPLTGVGPPLRGKNYAIPANSSNGAPLPISRW